MLETKITKEQSEAAEMTEGAQLTDKFDFKAYLAQIEQEEGASEYAEIVIKKIQETFEVNEAEARDWFEAIFRHGRKIDRSAIEQALDRVDVAQLYEILIPELEVGECSLENLQAVVDVLAEAFCVGHKTRLVIYQSNDVLEKNDYGRCLNFEWSPLEKTFKNLEIWMSRNELEENLASVSVCGIEKCLCILIGNLAHEVWHTYQAVRGFRIREKLSETHGEMLPTDCPQEMLYLVNFAVYVQKGVNKFFYDYQLVEREAEEVEWLISCRIRRFLC